MIDIIGAGVAGLCLGIRLQRGGRSTVIHEAGARPGGLCTGWHRGAYDFNGCLHWVLGARSGTSFHDMWRQVCDIDSLQFIDFDERVDIEVPNPDGSTWHFHLYNDVARLEVYLLSLSDCRDDVTLIRQWMNAIRTVARFIPNLPPFPQEKTFFGRMAHYAGLWAMWRMLPLMRKWGRLTTYSFAGQFHSPKLREAVRRLYFNETRMTVVIFGQAYMTSRVAAYPLGGSEALTNLLVREYEALGGRIEYNSVVEKIRVEGNRAVGLILADGRRTEAEAVCSCADWLWTVGQALDGKYVLPAQRKLLAMNGEELSNGLFYSYCRLHIGVARNLSSLPHFARLAHHYVLPDGTPFDQIELEVNHFDPHLAPEGHTTLTVNFTTRKGQWWIDLRNSDRAAYTRAKQTLASDIITLLSSKYSDLISPSDIEVVDVATPATYYRYTRNTIGSSQGWNPQPDITHRLPIGPTLPSLKRFALAGHWLEAGGGIPIALISALRAEKVILKQLEL